MRLIHVITLILCLCAILLLPACRSATTQNSTTVVPALERYFQALISKNENDFSRSICADWESQAFLEFYAYQGLELTLKDLACRSTDTEPGKAQVNCQGKILMSYGNERQEVDLSRRIYQLTYHQDGWLVCGFLEQNIEASRTPSP